MTVSDPAPPVALADSSLVPSLLKMLAQIPDPRSAQGRRHELPALLGLLLAGFMSRCNTVKAVVIHGRNHRAMRRQLGFTHKKSPSQSTYTRLFDVLPIESVRRVVVDWLEHLVEARIGRHKVPVAVDGKTLRGTGHHVLNVFVHDFWCLLDQREVGEKTNEMAGFRSILEDFLHRYPFVNLLTFDAMFCEQQTMKILTHNNRMGIFQVKDNQPETLLRLQRWFARQPKDAPDFRSVEKKWGLRGDSGTVGGRCPTRHCRQDSLRPPDCGGSRHQ